MIAAKRPYEVELIAIGLSVTISMLFIYEVHKLKRCS